MNCTQGTPRSDRLGAYATALTALRRLGTLERSDPERIGLREFVIGEYMSYARYVAGRFRRRGEASEDLEQVAYVGLVKAVDSYDAEFHDDVPDIRDAGDRRGDQATLPGHDVGRARAAPHAGVVGGVAPSARIAGPQAGARPDRLRVGGLPGRHARGGRQRDGRLGGLQRLLAGRAGRADRRRRGHPRRADRRRRSRVRPRRGPRVAQAAAGRARRAGQADPAAALLPQHVADRDR